MATALLAGTFPQNPQEHGVDGIQEEAVTQSGVWQWWGAACTRPVECQLMSWEPPVQHRPGPSGDGVEDVHVHSVHSCTLRKNLAVRG